MSAHEEKPDDPSSTNTTTSTSTPAQPHQPLLALPEIPANETTTINVGGDSVKLDHLGPMVVNQDGTLSRINNWPGLSEIEKRNTLRVLGKRNRERLESLKGREGKAA